MRKAPSDVSEAVRASGFSRKRRDEFLTTCGIALAVGRQPDARRQAERLMWGWRVAAIPLGTAPG